MMTPEQVYEAVDTINIDLMVGCADIGEGDLIDILKLKMHTDTIVHSVQFLGYYIWQSDVDDRDWLPQEGRRETLEEHLRERVDTIIGEMADIYEKGALYDTVHLDDSEEEEVEEDGTEDKDISEE